MIHTSLFTLPKQLVRVWRNEFTRCICDRLASEQVRCFFKRINDDDNSNATHTVKSQFGKENARDTILGWFFLLVLFLFTSSSAAAAYFWLFSYFVSFYFVSIVVGNFHASWISHFVANVWKSETARGNACEWKRASKRNVNRVQWCLWIHALRFVISCDGWHCYCSLLLLLNSIPDYSLTK